MAKTINWGIIGLGKIAHKFAQDLKLVDGVCLHAAASRNADKAAAFGKAFDARKTYGSYQELVADADVDIVYIATPHAFHFELTNLCLEHGKAVLCEKPLGMNAKQVEAMQQKAREKQLFLMEALWTRFIPGTEKLLQLMTENAIGRINHIRADFGFKNELSGQGRLFEKQLGGGSLLDIGIYPVYLSLLLLGMPDTIDATARFTNEGVDSYTAILFDYFDGEKAVLESGFEADMPTDAWIYGEHGRIHLHTRFHHPRKISIYRDNSEAEHLTIDYTGNGYYHEIVEVRDCLLAGKSESSRMPLEESLKLIRVLDRIRKQIGLSYDID